jgi:hypothetical protein
MFCAGLWIRIWNCLGRPDPEEGEGICLHFICLISISVVYFYRIWIRPLWQEYQFNFCKLFFTNNGPSCLWLHTNFRRKSLKCLQVLHKCRSTVPLWTLKICQLFRWPGRQWKGRIRIDQKSRIRILNKSFRIHNTSSWCRVFSYNCCR